MHADDPDSIPGTPCYCPPALPGLILEHRVRKNLYALQDVAQNCFDFIKVN